jgi:hypothetical protein
MAVEAGADGGRQMNGVRGRDGDRAVEEVFAVVQDVTKTPLWEPIAAGLAD